MYGGSFGRIVGNRTTAHQLRLISTTFDHIVFATEQMDVWGRWANGRNKSAARSQSRLKAAFRQDGANRYLSGLLLGRFSFSLLRLGFSFLRLGLNLLGG